MKNVLILIFMLYGLGTDALAQLTMPWSPMSRYRFFITDTNARGVRFIDGYRMQPRGFRHGQDSVWAAMPVEGNESAYNLCQLFNSPTSGTIRCYPNFSLVGDSVRWVSSKHCFRFRMKSVCDPGSCHLDDTLFIFPNAEIGGIGAIHTSRRYGRYNIYVYHVLNQYYGTVGSISDSLRSIGDSSGNIHWIISKNYGIVETNHLYGSGIKRRAISDSLWQRLPFPGATGWIDVRPGDFFDYYCSSSTLNNFNNWSSDTYIRHQFVTGIEWAQDSSQITINYWDLIPPGQDSTAYRDTIPKQIVLRRDDFLFADRKNFIPFSKGYTLFQKRNSLFYWGYTGDSPEFFPGYWQKNSSQSWQTWWSSGTHICRVQYIHSQRFGNMGIPLFPVVSVRPLQPFRMDAVPNPATTNIRFTEAAGATYRLFAVTGALVRSGVLDSQGILERRDIPPGLYAVELIVPDHQRISIRVAFE